jgi:hypothetical protein
MVSQEEKGDNLPNLSKVSLSSYMNDEGRCWPHQINNETNLWPTRETNNTH